MIAFNLVYKAISTPDNLAATMIASFVLIAFTYPDQEGHIDLQDSHDGQHQAEDVSDDC
jgi:hypothetical protein